MQADLHIALREAVFDKGHIDADEVEISFDLPTRDWIDGLTRPTLNFALIDMVENLTLRSVAAQTIKANRQAQMRLPPRRVDLRYMVTAFTTNHNDTQRLLWRAMVALMRTPELPAAFAFDSATAVDDEVPLQLRTGQPDEPVNTLEIWGTLGAEARPSFTCSVTVPVDLDMKFEAPLVFTRGTRYRRINEKQPEVINRDIGGAIFDAAGHAVSGVRLTIEGRAASATSDDAGTFVLRNVSEGKTMVSIGLPDGTSLRLQIAVPSESYDIHLT